jgi:hypothetical protein
MGGMGMGGMGGMGMGGGFRSVPPTGLPETTLNPSQSRRLPASLTSLRGPEPDGHIAFPAKGEALTLGQIGDLAADRLTAEALTRLAEEKAPQSVAQLVLWHLADGFEWETVAQYASSWANPDELALARQFADRIKEGRKHRRQREADAVFDFELTTEDSQDDAFAGELRDTLANARLLGLASHEGIPARPEGPAIACRVRLAGDVALVQFAVSSSSEDAWKTAGKAQVSLVRDGKRRSVAEVADGLAEAALGRLVTTKLTSHKARGKTTYTVRIENASPLVLNSLVLAGPAQDDAAKPTILLGLSLSPHRALTVPATEDAVRRLGLTKGLRPLAAQLDSL